MSLREIGDHLRAFWAALLDYPIPWETVFFWLLVPIWIWLGWWMLKSWFGLGAILTAQHRANIAMAWRMFLDRRRGG